MIPLAEKPGARFRTQASAVCGDRRLCVGVAWTRAIAACVGLLLLFTATAIAQDVANAPTTAAGNAPLLDKANQPHEPNQVLNANRATDGNDATGAGDGFNLADVEAHGRNLVAQAFDIWKQGGWAMPAIAANALIMFGMGMHVYLRLRSKGFRSVPERTWRRWLDHPEQRRGPIGEMLDFVTGGETLADTTEFFEELRATEIRPFQRDLLVMRICVSAAPLLGLLGTVTGMLSTFDALATGAGGDQTMDLVAKGISEALVTTETGLIIALPGLFFQYQLTRSHEQYRAFLTHLETVCTQKRYRELQQQRAA